jgi:hypothetical protein
MASTDKWSKSRLPTSAHRKYGTMIFRIHGLASLSAALPQNFTTYFFFFHAQSIQTPASGSGPVYCTGASLNEVVYVSSRGSWELELTIDVLDQSGFLLIDVCKRKRAHRYLTPGGAKLHFTKSCQFRPILIRPIFAIGAFFFSTTFCDATLASRSFCS